MARVRMLLPLAALWGWLMCGAAAKGSWAWTPTELLVLQARTIVEAEVTAVEPGPKAKPRDADDKDPPSAYDVVTLSVSAVLKGDAELKQVRLAQPAADRRMMASTDLTFRRGQAGIWILGSPDEAGLHRIGYPGSVLKRDRKQDVATMVAAHAKLPWGKPVGGLAGVVVPATDMGYPPDGSLSVVLAVRNASDQPLMLNTHAGHRPIGGRVTAPDGDAVQLKLYAWLKRARLKPPTVASLRVLEPGGTRVLTPTGSDWPDRIVLRPKAEPGTYRVRMTYANTWAPEALDLRYPLWTGTLEVGPAKVTVVPKAPAEPDAE